MNGVALVREYYRAIDEDDYAALANILGGGFVHQRPDTMIEGREEFIEFMKSARPDQDTEHRLEAIYTEDGGSRIAVEGRLCRVDGGEWFRFVDSFEISGRQIREIRTYTDAAPR
jgi:ketosteroid isomerase-like protein